MILIFANLLVAAGYLVLLKLGLSLASLHGSVSPVWPATGFSISVFIISRSKFGWKNGPALFPGIFLGAYIGNQLTGTPHVAALLMGLGNALEGFIGAEIYLKTKQSLTLRNKRAFGPWALFLACTLAPIVSATVGVFALWSSGLIKADLIHKVWWTWYLGDFLGGLIITPLAITARQFTKNFEKYFHQTVPLAMTIGLPSVLVSYLVFYADKGSSFLYALFPLIFLTTFSLNAFFGYSLVLIFSTMGILSTFKGLGPYVGGTSNQNLLNFQLTSIGLVLVAYAADQWSHQKIKLRLFWISTIAFTFLGWVYYSFHKGSAQENHTKFELVVQDAIRATQESINRYEIAMAAGASQFSIRSGISKNEWRNYYDALQLDKRYPGILGVGVVYPVAKDRLGQFVANRAQYGQREFKYHAIRGNEDPARKIDNHFIITFIEPLDRNAAALGLDLASETRRYEAAHKSRTLGISTVTAPIQLVQDKITRPGFLIFVPYFEGTPRAHKGWVYAPFIAQDFFQGIKGEFLKQIEFQFSDVAAKSPDGEAIYRSGNYKWDEKHGIRLTFDFLDRKLEIRAVRSNLFISQLDSSAAWIALLGALLTVIIVQVYGRTLTENSRIETLVKRQTQELRSRESMWKMLTQTLPVGMYQTDKRGKCIFVNPKWMEITGLTQEQAIEDDWVQAVHPDDRDRLFNAWNSFVEGKPFAHEYRFINRRSNPPKTIFVFGRATPIIASNGVIMGYIGTIEDVSDLKNQQLALASASRLSALGEMAGGIAHEINNPLAIISGQSQILSKKVAEAISSGLFGPIDNLDKTAWIEYLNSGLKKIQDTSVRISKIIKGLKTVSRSGENDPFTEVEVKPLIEGVAALCMEKFKNHSIQLSCQSVDGVYVLGRETQLSQVLINLLNNSYDALQDSDLKSKPETSQEPTSISKWIKLAAIENKGKIEIRVADSGYGISEEIVRKLMQPFFTTKPPGKGTGLGLSISKSIALDHGGTLVYDSYAEHTTFKLTLPIAKVSRAPKTAS